MGKENQIKNDAITRQEDDFAQWYTDVCRKAELMDYSSVKGFIIYRPYGYTVHLQLDLTYLTNLVTVYEMTAVAVEQHYISVRGAYHLKVGQSGR